MGLAFAMDRLSLITISFLRALADVRSMSAQPSHLIIRAAHHTQPSMLRAEKFRMS